MKKNTEYSKERVEEMTQTWTAEDEYGRGVLDGIIRAVLHMAAKKETEKPVA